MVAKKTSKRKAMPRGSDSKAPEKLLLQIFLRNGHLREPDILLKKQLGQKYKKGYEVRLVANSRQELRDIRRALKAVDLNAGSHFKKNRQTVQPVYGKEAVGLFKSWVSTSKKRSAKKASSKAQKTTAKRRATARKSRSEAKK